MSGFEYCSGTNQAKSELHCQDDGARRCLQQLEQRAAAEC